MIIPRQRLWIGLWIGSIVFLNGANDWWNQIHEIIKVQVKRIF